MAELDFPLSPPAGAAFTTFDQYSQTVSQAKPVLKPTATPGRALSVQEKLKQRAKGKEAVSLSPPPNPFELAQATRSATLPSHVSPASPKQPSPVRHAVDERTGRTSPTKALTEVGRKRRLLIDQADGEQQPERREKKRVKIAVADKEEPRLRLPGLRNEFDAVDGRQPLPPPAMGMVQSPKKKKTQEQHRQAPSARSDKKASKKRLNATSRPADAETKSKTERVPSKPAFTCAASDVWEIVLAAAEEVSDDDAVLAFVRNGQATFELLQTLSQRRRDRKSLQMDADRLHDQGSKIQNKIKEEESLWQRARLRSELLGEINVALLKRPVVGQSHATALSLEYQLRRLADLD